MRIAIGSDHRGLKLKGIVADAVQELGYESQDFGCYDSTPVDYPDVAKKVSEAVASGECGYGILVCGTGIGMSISANKMRGIRAALCADSLSARWAREHNDANVLCLGAEVVGPGLAKEIVTTYLQAQFQGGRHARRVEKMAALDR